MKKLDQRGTGIVEVLLILVIVGLIGFVGWYVWNSRQNTDRTLQQAGNQNSATVTKKAASPSVNSQQYLEIKEWGVKIPLSDEIKDAYYFINTKDVGRGDYAYFGTRTMTAIDAGCAPDATSLGGVARQTVAEHDANQVKGSNMDSPVYSLKAGNYYYAFVHNQSSCTQESNAKTDQMQMDDSAAFNLAVKRMVVSD